MHIGFDISQTGSSKAGCGFFSHAMITALLDLAPAHRYSLYPSFGDFYFDSLMPRRNVYAGGAYGPRHSTQDDASAFWTVPDLERQLNRPDIIHANNFWCPTQLTSTRLIYTFYDMGFLQNANWSTEGNRLGCFEGVFRSSLVADWIVSISEASRVHYLETFPHFPHDHICVIHPCSRFTDLLEEGVRPASLAHISSQKFWLSVGTIEPRKNHFLLAEAYARYCNLGGVSMPLVLAGGEGWMMENFREYLCNLGVESQVIVTGYISDQELIWLYRNCYANLYPSLFEGFGLPVLEGMQFSAPTFISDAASLIEVAGEAAVILPTFCAESWALAMVRLERYPDERARLARLAQQRSKKFSWQRSAASLLELYKNALSVPKRRHCY